MVESQLLNHRVNRERKKDIPLFLRAFRATWFRARGSCSCKRASTQLLLPEEEEQSALVPELLLWSSCSGPPRRNCAERSASSRSLSQMICATAANYRCLYGMAASDRQPIVARNWEEPFLVASDRQPWPAMMASGRHQRRQRSPAWS